MSGAKPIRKPYVQPASNDPCIGQGRAPEHRHAVVTSRIGTAIFMWAVSVLGAVCIGAVIAKAIA